MSQPTWSTDASTTAKLSKVSTATLTTQLFKRGFRSRVVRNAKPLRPGLRMVGAARTLRYIPAREDIDTLGSLGARNNAQRRVIEDVRPGEVLVIDGMRDQGAGSLGSILARRLQALGAAGIVTDGAFRDTPGIRHLNIPAFAAGQNPNTNVTIYHPADFDLPIGCGGAMVEPGDAVVGDEESVVVIPAHLVTEVATEAYEQEVKERFIFGLVEDGASVFRVYPMDEETTRQYEAWLRENPQD